MEIISYVGGSAAVRGGRFSFPKIELPKLKPFYPLLALKKIGSYLWVLPLLALIALVPFGANKAFEFMQNRANPLALKDAPVDEMKFLQDAMSEFALSSGEAIDDDGNLEGVSATASFHDKVTYQTYKVKAGETIGGITRKFGLKNISTIIAVNSIENVRQVYSGQKLVIPSCDGLKYKVKAGNTIQGISAKYGTAVEDLLDANDLDSLDLTVGQELFIPGAKLDREALRKAMGESWSIPLKGKWRLTSKCGWRGDPFTGVKQYHPGIDMACPTGTPIYAALGGKVLQGGFSRIYGNYVIIDHGNGFQTLYGHMSKRISSTGDYVQQGQKIGLVGSTGYSTGPHLHWTVYKNGKVVDPLTIIKR
ncbi:MAG: M23 family metallopeptidase [Treponema sp.]|nr:M23 family metallopeptidase [Treponema sp.]